jgi:tetratricopeptide (TPR) repeat protein
MFAHRHFHARWLLALSMIPLLLARHSAAADSPSDEAVVDERRAAAKTKYQQGADAYSAGNYKDAVDLFLAADHLAPSAPLSFNIARAYEKLGDDSGSLRWYRDFLRRNPNAANAENVRSLIATLAQALAKKGVQQLTVLSSPAGATVTIDDQPLGVTPWTGELSPGKHHVLLTERGYTDGQRDVDLARTEPMDLTVRLEQRPEPVAPLAATPVSAPTAPPPASAPRPSKGGTLGVLPWVTLGASAAAFGGALTFELLRRGAESDAKKETTQLGYQAQLSTEQSRQTTARVFLGVGGGLLIGGAIMLLVDSHAPAQPASAGLLCVPGACAVTARGRF